MDFGHLVYLHVFLVLFHCVFPTICLSIIPQLNDAVGWILVIWSFSMCFLSILVVASFICLLFNMYSVGTVGRDLDAWTSSKALFNLMILLGGFFCFGLSP